MGIMGAGSAKGKKSWFRRTEGLGGPEALLSMGTGFLLGLPLCQVLVLAVQALPWGSKVGGGAAMGAGGSGSGASSMGALDSHTGIITTVMGWG